MLGQGFLQTTFGTMNCDTSVLSLRALSILVAVRGPYLESHLVEAQQPQVDLRKWMMRELLDLKTQVVRTASRIETSRVETTPGCT